MVKPAANAARSSSPARSPARSTRRRCRRICRSRRARSPTPRSARREAGAAIVHLHARDPVDGRPTQDPEAFRQFAAPTSSRRCDVVHQLHHRRRADDDDRGAPAALRCSFKPEVASLNMGSMNFGLFPMLQRFNEFKYDWERPYLEGSDERIFKNTFKDIEYILTSCADNGTRFEIECYDIGHLYTLRHFARSRHRQAAALHPERVRHPGRHRPAPRGRRAHEAHRRPAVRRPVSLERARRGPQPAADRGAVGGDGRQRPRRAGGQLWIGPGKLAESNAAQVRAVRQDHRGHWASRSQRPTRRARCSR